ncbi:MAG: hypothetical protein KDA51_06930, partial [Planctomycetales bacterium]|nr:hypothetical protein [Planctomycetales bacterium]
MNGKRSAWRTWAGTKMIVGRRARRNAFRKVFAEQLEARIVLSADFSSLTLPAEIRVGASCLANDLQQAPQSTRFNSVEAAVSQVLVGPERWVSNLDELAAVLSTVDVRESLPPGNIKFLSAGLSPDEFTTVVPARADAIDTANVYGLRPTDTNSDLVDPRLVDLFGSSRPLGLTGEGVSVGVFDYGTVLATHAEFGNRVTVDPASTGQPATNHATHVAGIIGGAQGFAPNATLHSFDASGNQLVNRLASIEAAAPNLQVANLSIALPTGWQKVVDQSVLPPQNDISGSQTAIDAWFGNYALFVGQESPGFGKYIEETSRYDQILFDNPKLVGVISAGNDRGQAFENHSGSGNFAIHLKQPLAGVSGYENPGWYLVSPSPQTPLPEANGGTAGFDTMSALAAKNAIVVGAVYDQT